MGTIAEKLQAIINSKASIKSALESKGLTVGDDFSTYGELIRSLPVAGVDITSASEFVFNPTGLPISATNVQEAVAEICGYLPIACALDADSTGDRLVVNNNRVTLRDNLMLIIRTHLTLRESAAIVYNGTVRPLLNKDGTSALNIANGASFFAVFNEEKQEWYIL